MRCVRMGPRCSMAASVRQTQWHWLQAAAPAIGTVCVNEAGQGTWTDTPRPPAKWHLGTSRGSIRCLAWQIPAKRNVVRFLQTHAAVGIQLLKSWVIRMP